MNKEGINKVLLLGLISLLSFLLGRYWSAPIYSQSYMNNSMHNYMHQQMHRDYDGDGGTSEETYSNSRDDLFQELLSEGKYRCCLEKPCSYCLKEDGEGCDCLEDVMNGKHPCGECMGEILEGKGNRFIAKYFATAIADEVGEDHMSELKQIISEKYNIGIDEQI